MYTGQHPSDEVRIDVYTNGETVTRVSCPRCGREVTVPDASQIRGKRAAFATLAGQSCAVPDAEAKEA